MTGPLTTATSAPSSSTSMPSDMPIATMIAGSRRKSQGWDENAPASRIPVRSPPRRALGAASNNAPPQSPSLKRISNFRFAGKPSIPFPLSSRPAPPVVTNITITPIAEATLRLLTIDKEDPPKLGKRARPSTVAKAKWDRRPPGETCSPLWKTLQEKGKTVIGQTLNSDLLLDQHSPYGATMLTPMLLLEGLSLQESAFHAWIAARQAIEDRQKGEWDFIAILHSAIESYLVALGAELLQDVQGPHFTFLDPRQPNHANAMVRQALRLIKLFEKKEYNRDRIVISIPATEAGIHAAKQLEGKYNMRTNLMYVSGLAHAAICAEAGASYVTFSYAALTEAIVQNQTSNRWARALEALSPSSKRLADEAIESTAEYFRIHGIKTRVLLSLRGTQTLGEAQRLKGFDAIVLDANQSQEAKLTIPTLLPAGARTLTERSATKVRAREVRYPTSYLTSKSGAFASAMSADERRVAEGTLRESLQYLMSCMDNTCAQVFKFLQCEVQVAHLDNKRLESLYEDDISDLNRISAMIQAEESAGHTIVVRDLPVGFRMAFSTWDRDERGQGGL